MGINVGGSMLTVLIRLRHGSVAMSYEELTLNLGISWLNERLPASEKD
jgi:hypothetical protein